MRIVVATVVHHPEDARIYYRQIPALLEAGHEVVYLAPPADGNLDQPGLVHIPIRRSVGTRRFGALKSAAKALAETTGTADLAIIHDPELTLLVPWIRCHRVWDVHENLASQIADKAWIPRLLRGPVSLGARLAERWAAQFFEVMVAEPTYSDRFPCAAVVRNTPRVIDCCPPSGADRLVCVGRVSRGRGIESMLEAMRLIGPSIVLDLYGPVDEGIASLLEHPDSNVVVHGFLQNPQALDRIAGAMAGLALLENRPDYRQSIPTKILEYMAHGVPVITTANLAASQIVEESKAGIVVPFDSPEAVANAVNQLRDPIVRAEMGRNGREAIRVLYDWTDDASRMLNFLDNVAGGKSSLKRWGLWRDPEASSSVD